MPAPRARRAPLPAIGLTGLAAAFGAIRPASLAREPALSRIGLRGLWPWAWASRRRLLGRAADFADFGLLARLLLERPRGAPASSASPFVPRAARGLRATAFAGLLDGLLELGLGGRLASGLRGLLGHGHPRERRLPNAPCWGDRKNLKLYHLLNRRDPTHPTIPRGTALTDRFALTISRHRFMPDVRCAETCDPVTIVRRGPPGPCRAASAGPFPAAAGVRFPRPSPLRPQARLGPHAWPAASTAQHPPRRCSAACSAGDRLVLRRGQRASQHRLVRGSDEMLHDASGRQRLLAFVAERDERGQRRALGRPAIVRAGHRERARQFRLEQQRLDQFTHQRRSRALDRRTAGDRSRRAANRSAGSGCAEFWRRTRRVGARGVARSSASGKPDSSARRLRSSAASTGALNCGEQRSRRGDQRGSSLVRGRRMPCATARRAGTRTAASPARPAPRTQPCRAGARNRRDPRPRAGTGMRRSCRRRGPAARFRALATRPCVRRCRRRSRTTTLSVSRKSFCTWVGRRRRAQRRDGIVDAVLRQRDDVHVALRRRRPRPASRIALRAENRP